MTNLPSPGQRAPGTTAAAPSSTDVDLDAWDPWTPQEVAEHLAGVAVPWWVCGGWALDLFRGEQSREHEDLEFAVCRRDFPAVSNALLTDGQHEHFFVGDGRAHPLGSGELPPEEYTQVWTRHRDTAMFRTDTFLDPGDRDEWVCKHDRRLRRPLGQAIGVSRDGIPYQRPELVLLMKAKHRRDKDEQDLAGTLPLLGDDQRRWLFAAVELVYPDHAWLRALSGAGEH